MNSTRLSQDKSSIGPRWPGFVEVIPQNVPKFFEKFWLKLFFFQKYTKSSELLSHSHVEMHRVSNCVKFPQKVSQNSKVLQKSGVGRSQFQFSLEKFKVSL